MWCMITVDGVCVWLLFFSATFDKVQTILIRKYLLHFSTVRKRSFPMQLDNNPASISIDNRPTSYQ